MQLRTASTSTKFSARATGGRGVISFNNCSKRLKIRRPSKLSYNQYHISYRILQLPPSYASLLRLDQSHGQQIFKWKRKEVEFSSWWTMGHSTHCRLHCATVVIYNGHNWIPKQAHNHFPQRYGTWQWPSFFHWHHDPLNRMILSIG